jgi:hypothetical protein
MDIIEEKKKGPEKVDWVCTSPNDMWHFIIYLLKDK